MPQPLSGAVENLIYCKGKKISRIMQKKRLRVCGSGRVWAVDA